MLYHNYFGFTFIIIQDILYLFQVPYIIKYNFKYKNIFTNFCSDSYLNYPRISIIPYPKKEYLNYEYILYLIYFYTII